MSTPLLPNIVAHELNNNKSILKFDEIYKNKLPKQLTTYFSELIVYRLLKHLGVSLSETYFDQLKYFNNQKIQEDLKNYDKLSSSFFTPNVKLIYCSLFPEYLYDSPEYPNISMDYLIKLVSYNPRRLYSILQVSQVNTAFRANDFLFWDNLLTDELIKSIIKEMYKNLDPENLKKISDHYFSKEEFLHPAIALLFKILKERQSWEGAMTKYDLKKLSQYSLDLIDKENDPIEHWLITGAINYELYNDSEG